MEFVFSECALPHQGRSFISLIDDYQPHLQGHLPGSCVCVRMAGLTLFQCIDACCWAQNGNSYYMARVASVNVTSRKRKEWKLSSSVYMILLCWLGVVSVHLVMLAMPLCHFISYALIIMRPIVICGRLFHYRLRPLRPCLEIQMQKAMQPYPLALATPEYLRLLRQAVGDISTPCLSS